MLYNNLVNRRIGKVVYMGGRSSASGKAGGTTLSSSDFEDELENYVGGGYGSPSEALSKRGINYLKSHMEKSSSPLYRVEDSRYTASGLKVGSTFQFEGNYRSFSSRSSFVDEAINEYGVGGRSPAVFVMKGTKNSLSVNKHYSNPYHYAQQEHIAGGKYKVTKKEQKDGKTYVYIEQLS